jgi:ribose transport system substrate-binding protein
VVSGGNKTKLVKGRCKMKRVKFMKKLLWVLCALLIAASFCMFGCEKEEEEVAAQEEGQETAASAEEPKETYKIGYSCISWTIPWMVYYQELFKKEMEKYPNYEVLWHDAKFDYQLMADGLENFIAEDVDMILHFALDSLPMLETYKKVNAAGIPLMLTMDPPDFKAYEYMTLYSGLDTRDVGRKCALMLEEVLNGKGQIALITAPAGSSSEQQYTEGFMFQLQRMDSKLEIVAKQPGDWDIETSQKVANDILTKYPELDGIYVSDDWMGGGVVRALKERGYAPGEVKIAAAGGSKIGIKDFKDGWYIGIVDQGPNFCAPQDILMMRLILEQGLDVPKVAIVPQTIITEENVDQFPGSW